MWFMTQVTTSKNSPSKVHLRSFKKVEPYTVRNKEEPQTARELQELWAKF